VVRLLGPIIFLLVMRGLIEMTHQVTPWIQDRLYLVAAGVANAAGWAMSIDTGAAITGMTAALGLAAYGIKTIGNAITEVKVNRDKQMAGSLSDQMDRLNANLEASQKESVASAKLADLASKQADRLQQMLEEIKGRLEDANKKLHSERNEAMVHMGTIALLRTELDDYKARLGPILFQVGVNKAAIKNVADSVAKVHDATDHVDHPE
jgi:hypothetical protein